MSQKEQTSLEKAFLDFSNLKKHAQEELMGQLEEKVEEKLLALINEMESESQESLNEDVTVTVNVNGQEVAEIHVDDDTEDESFEDVESPEEEEEEIEDMFEITSDAESFEIANEMNNPFEITDDMNNSLEEQVPATPEAAPAPAPTPAPAPEATGGSAEEKIIDGIKQLIAQDGGGQEAAPEAGEEIDIVDDAAMGVDPMAGVDAAAAPAQEAPIAEEFDADEIFEIIDNMDDEDAIGRKPEGPFSDDDITWDDVIGEDDDLYEITLDIDETGDADLEEMKAMGQSHSVQRGTGRSAGPEVAVKNRSRQAVRESNVRNNADNTARYEAIIAGLNKENESLKAKVNEQTKEIKKFHESFVELRSQFNEMQTFNAKLAYANKLFANGEFSQEEKLQIAESFDKTSNVNDAKKLYNSIISENKLNVVNVQKEIAATGPKAAKPANPQPSQHNVLYESAEIKRMRQLAGIRNNS